MWKVFPQSGRPIFQSTKKGSRCGEPLTYISNLNQTAVAARFLFAETGTGRPAGTYEKLRIPSPNSTRLMMERPSVTSSAYSISSPMETPRAMTVTFTG